MLVARVSCFIAATLIVCLVAGTPAGAQVCAGDCDAGGTVGINELITCVNLALGSPQATCAECDANGDGQVAINDLIQAVNAALAGCPVAPPSPTASPIGPSPTATPPTPTPSATMPASPTATRTAGSASPTVTPPPPSPTAMAVATPTRTEPLAGTATATATASSAATASRTATSASPSPTAIDPRPRGAFQRVDVSAEGTARLALLSRAWLLLLEDALRAAIADDDELAARCPGAVTVTCTAGAAGAERTIAYDDCASLLPSGAEIVRNGRVVQRAPSAALCDGAAAAPGESLTIELQDYAQREQIGGAPRAALEATLTVLETVQPASGCPGTNLDWLIDGRLDADCDAGAESVRCGPQGLTATVSPRGLSVLRRAVSPACAPATTLAGGRWTVDDAASGEHIVQSFEGFTVTERAVPGDEVARAVELQGAFTADCLGAVAVDTASPLIVDGAGGCPQDGALRTRRVTGAAQPAPGQLDATAVAAAVPRGAGGDGLTQRLFRAANGQVYQVMQFAAGAGDNGAEALRLTTVAGSLGDDAAACVNAGTVPTAVAAVAPGSAFALERVFKSPLLPFAGPPCFNRNAAQGNGRLCVGVACTNDCICPPAAACAEYSLGTDPALRTPISADGPVPAASLVTLEPPFPPCDGFAGRHAYRFGSGGPTTNRALCAAPPADGVLLPDGTSVVLAYDTAALELFNASAAGLLIDEDGDNAGGCGAQSVLSPGRLVDGTAFAARTEFTAGGGARYYYDADETSPAPAADESLPICTAGALIECDEVAPPPPPSPNPDRPCNATDLGAGASATAPGSTVDQADHAGGASCGWSGGGSAFSDRTFEYVAAAAGRYDIEVVGEQAFDPLLYVRDDDCQGEELACDPGTMPGRASVQALPLAAGQRVAIVVDGTRQGAGAFTVSVRRRQADLLITGLTAPASAAAGDAVNVAAQVMNRGDETAPAFEIDFVLARDAAGNEPVSIVPLRCQVAGGLAAGQSTTCTAANPFALPLVAAGDYHLVATVDRLGQVSESDDENNRNTAPLALTTAAGVALEQRLFRALDGTVYQLVQAVPQRAATAADAFRITTLAGAVGEVADCTVAGTQPGATAAAAAASAALPSLAGVQRSAVLRPNGFDPLFDAERGGRLALGAGGGRIEVCARAETCNGASLVPLTQASGGVPAACVTTVTGPGPCAGGSALAFARSDGSCGGAQTTTSRQVCDAPPADGLALQPGEAVLFVHAPGRDAFDVGIGAFGTARVQGTAPCVGVVQARALAGGLERAPLLAPIGTLTGGEAQIVALSPEPTARHLYLIANGSLHAFRRSATAGTLEPIQQLAQGVNGIRGLELPYFAELTRDGRHLYIAGAGGLAVFARESASGALSLVEAQRGVVAAQGTPRSVAVSPDGRHLYGLREDGIATFARDAGSGTLTLLDVVPVPGGGEFATFNALALSGDGRHLYADGSSGLSVYARQPGSDSLELIETYPESGVPFLSPGGEQVYVASFTRIVTLQRGTDGRLSGRTTLEPGLNPDLAFRFSSDGEYLYAAGAGASVSIFTRSAEDGALAFQEDVDGIFQSPNASPYSVEITPDGEFAYVASASDLATTILDRKPLDGTLEVVETRREPGGELSATVDVAASGDGAHLYSVSFLDEAVVISRRDPESGRLAVTGAARDGVDGVIGLFEPSRVAVSPDGRHVYASDPTSATFLAFARDAASGGLAIVALYQDPDPPPSPILPGGRPQFPGAIPLPDSCCDAKIVPSPDGKYLYLSNGLILRRDEVSGQLQLAEPESSFGGGVDLAIGPGSGEHVYVAAEGIRVATRQPNTGALQFDDAKTVVGPHNVIALSPDGKHLYADRGELGGIAIFDRAADGSLTFDSTNGELQQALGDPAAGPGQFALSPDGRYLFGAISGVRLIAAFARNADNGALHLLELQGAGLEGDFFLPDGPVISPDSRHVYQSTGNGIAGYVLAE